MRLTLIVLALAVAGFLWSVVSAAPLLPENVAVHFNATGQANGWMPRSQHLLTLSSLAFGLPTFIIGLCFCFRFLPPSLLSVPQADYWRSPEHYPEACRILLQWAVQFSVISLLWTAALNQLIAKANQASPPHLPTTSVFFLTVAYLIALAVLIGLLFWRFASPQKS